MMENMINQIVNENTRYRDDEPMRVDLILTRESQINDDLRYQ